MLCITCGKKIQKGETVILVDNIYNTDTASCCSTHCATTFKNYLIKTYENKLEYYKKQELTISKI